MATIQKLSRQKGFVYRVLIRNKGYKTMNKTFSSRRLAIEFAKRVEGNKEEMLAYGSLVNRIKFDKVVSEYFIKSYKGKRPREQRWKLMFWSQAFGERVIQDISRRDIVAALELLPKRYSNATRNRFRAALSAVYRFACQQSYLTDNPVSLIAAFPENNARTRYLSHEERRLLFKAARASHWNKLYLLILMAITTGARKGELMGLTWDSIDRLNSIAIVPNTKNGEPRVLPLTAAVVEELSHFDCGQRGYIFNSTLGPTKQRCFKKCWYKALKDADIEDFRFHDLRHSCASYLAMNGASLLEIADVLGHKQIQMTKRYAHLCIEHKSSLINRVMGGI